MRHQPVMRAECLEFINPIAPKIHADGTLGAGGHARAVIESTLSLQSFIGIDRDAHELKQTEQQLQEIQSNCKKYFLHTNFCDGPSQIQKLIPEIQGVDSILLDLGCSSMQLNNPERGFSFRYDAPLDMRMDRTQSTTAADLVMDLEQKRLEDIIREYGQDRYFKLLARNICAYREHTPIKTTFDLLKASGLWGKTAKRHPATKLFQALRIAVNQELDYLQGAIENWLNFLNPAGRMLVITFHSLEDRIVKQTFKAATRDAKFTLCTKKPIDVSFEEVQQNPRARSAKLRVIEKNPF